MMKHMKHHLTLILALIMGILTAQANEITIGNLRFEIPDSARWDTEVPQGYRMRAWDNDFYMLIAAIDAQDLDVNKIRMMGDSIYFPKLKDLTPLEVKTDTWNQWTREYETHHYKTADGHNITVHHIMDKWNCYLIYLYAENEAGQLKCTEVLATVQNGQIFNNAPWFWVILLFIVGMFLLFRYDDGLRWGDYFITVIATIAITGAITLYFCWEDKDLWLEAMIWIGGFIILVPILRKPIVWVLEHAD